MSILPDTLSATAPFNLAPSLGDAAWQAFIQLAQARLHMPEADAVSSLLAHAQLSESEQRNTQTLAHTWIAALRSRNTQPIKQLLPEMGVDKLLHEFPLDSEAGVALMCLAEALLRIPDHPTVDALIRDKLAQGAWEEHLGTADSVFANATTWSLLLANKLGKASAAEALRPATLKNTLNRLLEQWSQLAFSSLVRRAMLLGMRLLGEKFVLGETIQDALQHAQAGQAEGFRYSFDILGEAAVTAADAQRYYQAYADGLAAVATAAQQQAKVDGRALDPIWANGISIKLSALHPRYQPSQQQRVMQELYPKLLTLLEMAQRANIAVHIDAEECERLELSLALLARLLDEPRLLNWGGLGWVVQAYQKRAPAILTWLIQAYRIRQRKYPQPGCKLLIRLVKGAYWDSEIKRAQVEGLPYYPVYTRKSHTDVSYLACARQLLDACDVIFPQFATHNAHSVAAIYSMAHSRGLNHSPWPYEFQCLHGMGEALYRVVRASFGAQPACRVYAPVGKHTSLLPYLVRRVLENGANSSFVHQLVDPSLAIDTLTVDPVAHSLAQVCQPASDIPLPENLYQNAFTARRNSLGLDWGSSVSRQQLAQQLSAQQQWLAEPLLAQQAIPSVRESIRVRNPADPHEVVGGCELANSADIVNAYRAAEESGWSQIAPSERAAILQRAADLLFEHTPELLSLCVREAGKTVPNALAEVREAIDYLRYYAAQATTLASSAHALGITVCISPWNFPLAIYLGQVSAALAAGNPVLAKPAAQTPLIAHRATQLLFAAGVPRNALQLLTGGADIGNALVRQHTCAAVLFTGSHAVAKLIAAQLLQARPSPALLVAETGGLNTMLVDSSALLEQVVQDVITSAFDSAGQRCSALRLLCVQNDIADKLLTMLLGAMAEFELGDPRDWSTDIPPIIDNSARQRILAYIDACRKQGWRVQQSARNAQLAMASESHWVTPTLIELPQINALSTEIFGPVLHIVRYAQEQKNTLIAQINALGYGLTAGIHSRLQAWSQQASSDLAVGNVYLNRNMVGATVGVQPFGGRGLSGTGPKAGGPWMLYRLLQDVVPPAAQPAQPPLVFHQFWQALQRLPTHLLSAATQSALNRYASEVVQHCRWRSMRNLTGPTGEANLWQTEARGTALCDVGDPPPDTHQNTPSIAALAPLILLALGNGNRVQIIAAQEFDWLAAILAQQPELSEWIGYCTRAQAAQAPHCWQSYLLGMAEAHAINAARHWCAQVQAALVPILPQPSARAGWHLVYEKVICTNLTAVGGNTQLLGRAQN